MRIHDDRGAAISARVVAARAYTVGSDIVFGAGEYRPSTREGRTADALLKRDWTAQTLDPRGPHTACP